MTKFAQKVVNTETYYCEMRHHDRITHSVQQHTKNHTHIKSKEIPP